MPKLQHFEHHSVLLLLSLTEFDALLLHSRSFLREAVHDGDVLRDHHKLGFPYLALFVYVPEDLFELCDALLRHSRILIDPFLQVSLHHVHSLGVVYHRFVL